MIILATNFDEILKNEAFKNIEPEKIEAIKNMSEEIKGKSTIEALKIFSKYNDILKQGKSISNEERDLMIRVILENMDEAERKKAESMMKLIKFSV